LRSKIPALAFPHRRDVRETDRIAVDDPKEGLSTQIQSARSNPTSANIEKSEISPNITGLWD